MMGIQQALFFTGIMVPDLRFARSLLALLPRPLQRPFNQLLVDEQLYGQMCEVMQSRVGSVELVRLLQMGLCSPDVLRDWVDEACARAAFPTGGGLILGGHSFGGVLALENALNNPNVKAVMAFGAPLAGSPHAWMAPLLPGVSQLLPGSDYLTRLSWNTAQAGLQFRRDGRRLPEIHLVSSASDVMVPCASAHAFNPGYPPELVHRYCLAEGPHRCHPEAKLIPTRRQGLDAHLAMMWMREALNWMDATVAELVLRGNPAA